MNITLLRQCRQLFNSPFVPASTNRHNQRAWVASVRRLGDRWIMRGGAAKWGNK